jgi:hypothetical protein
LLSGADLAIATGPTPDGAARRHSLLIERLPLLQKKENPAVGTPGQTLLIIGVYGF